MIKEKTLNDEGVKNYSPFEASLLLPYGAWEILWGERFPQTLHGVYRSSCCGDVETAKQKKN